MRFIWFIFLPFTPIKIILTFTNGCECWNANKKWHSICYLSFLAYIRRQGKDFACKFCISKGHYPSYKFIEICKCLTISWIASCLPHSGIYYDYVTYVGFYENANGFSLNGSRISLVRFDFLMLIWISLLHKKMWT